ncbi:MAG: molybdenum cofactor cytidylyltransferase [Deltaproteobacteria bacterium]|nr:molybdenum cofactor cytidylyltransferase [Deltaproteobacteria bacterium]
MNEDDRCKVAGIILAAGAASRMNRIKQLLPFQGKTLLGHVIEKAVRSSLSEVIVVLGRYADIIQRVMDVESFPKTRVVINQNWDKGQSTSLQAGLAAVSANCEGAMCILGDQPLIDVRVIDTLISEYHRTKAPLVIPTCRGRRGNPVVIHRSLFPQLKSLTGDVGARAFFEEYAEQIVEIEVTNYGIHLDIDTWQDYLRLKTTRTD